MGEFRVQNLEEELRRLGNELSQFPTQVDQLLSLLDEAGNLLAVVEQSPAESIQDAYSQCVKALLAEPILRHTDADVQVAVASCFCEFLRITAPEAPCSDNQLKEVFLLIVSSFENLSDISSRSYGKRASILENVAMVRSVILLLDLECHGLILELFHHFLSSIRDFHPEKIFRSMVNIMTLVLEESDDVSLELLIPILASLKRNNEEVSTSARKLGESVLARCAVKLEPYLKQAVKSLGLPLDGYTEIVSTICNKSNGKVEHNSGNVSLQKEKLEATELVSKPFRHDDEIVAIDKNDRAVDETEHIQTEIDNTASGDNSPASGKKFQSQSQTTTSKRTTESKNDDERSSKLEETISILAGALKDIVDDRKLPIPVDELWGFIHEMKLDEDLAGDAFVFLLDRPVQLKGLISTPIGIRKPILLKMMMRGAK